MEVTDSFALPIQVLLVGGGFAALEAAPPETAYAPAS